MSRHGSIRDATERAQIFIPSHGLCWKEQELQILKSFDCLWRGKCRKNIKPSYSWGNLAICLLKGWSNLIQYMMQNGLNWYKEAIYFSTRIQSHPLIQADMVYFCVIYQVSFLDLSAGGAWYWNMTLRTKSLTITLGVN